MKPVIYQILPRLWGEGRFSSVDAETFAHLRKLGVTHIWYTGIPRHATGEPFVKGNPGSPYAVSDWYDVNPYLADDPQRRIEEFESLVKRTHEAGFKVLTDFVPNHVACNYSDTRGGIPLHPYCDYDWTDTLKVNYDDPATAGRLTDILRYWASKGVDGFRCDMVELVPPQFFRDAITALKAEFPGLMFIAEVYSFERYGFYLREVGFDCLYDKSGLYDSLHSIMREGRGAWKLTRNWQRLGGLQPQMLCFLENHDEVRAASPAFAGSAQKTLAALGAATLLNTAPVMIYFGEEVGEDAGESDNCRTSIFNFSKPEGITSLWRYLHGGKGLSAARRSFLKSFRSIVSLCAKPVISEGLTYDLCYCNGAGQGFDPERHFVFLRALKGDAQLVCCNFSEQPASLDLFVPDHAFEFLGIEKSRLAEGDGLKAEVSAWGVSISRFPR